MGGKTKQSQRTKNNVRPSSSGRSAELLSNVNTDFNLLKLSIGSGQSTLFPTLTTISLELGLTPEFQICIKKLNKKDPITKIKALQELCELVNTNKVEEVLSVLPSWAHFYKILTVDIDRKVRESTQACHGAVVGLCGRQIAPQLKQLLPAWLQALHDDHAPAQTLALNSLKKTFPDTKLPDVLSFCKAEVIAHLLDSLIGDAESVLTRKMESTEEKEFQHYQLVTSSLRGLEYFTLHLSASHDDWLWTELAPLLQSNVFWKFASYSVHQIRAAWYATTGRLIERFKTTFGEKYATKTMRIVLGTGKDTNAVVSANMWACLLQLMHSVPEWHKYLEKKQLLSKRILDMLENGGWGDARHLSTLLLPLLAHLPPDIFNKDFYQSFFNAIYAGLEQKNILCSKSERQSWINSLAECLKYLSIQEYGFVVELVTSVHRTWLQKVLCADHDPQTTANLVKCSATNMAAIVKYWLKHSNDKISEKYDQLIRNFWQNIGSTASTQIDKLSTDHEEISQLVEHHVLLLKTLKTSFLQDPKKQQSIKFEVDSEAVVEKTPEPTQQCDAPICERYKHNLEHLVHTICSKYFQFGHSKEVCDPVMSQLFSLLIEFDDEKLFLWLASQFEVDTVYKLYDNILRNWLMGDTMRCKSLVDIVFLLLKHMSEVEQNCMMDSFQQFPGEVVEWCVCVSVSHPHREWSAVRTWARGTAVHTALVALCRRLLTAGSGSGSSPRSPDPRNLLLSSLAHDHHGELLVGTEAVSSILQIVCEALEDLHSCTLDQCGSLAAMLATTLPPTTLQLYYPYRQLLLRLFLLNYHVPRGDIRLSVETWCEVRSSWQDGISCLSEDQRLSFLLDLVNIIQRHTFDNSEGLHITRIENVTSLCPYLLSKDSTPPEDLLLTSTFTQKLFESDVKSMEPFALHYDCIFSNLNCPFENDNEHLKSILDEQQREMSKPDVEGYLNNLLFRSLYLKMVLLHKGDEDDDELWCDPLFSDEQMLMEFCKVMYDYSIVCSLYEGYAFWRHYEVLKECKEKLETVLTDIITESSPNSKTLVLRKLSELAASVGYYWSYATKYFELFAKFDADKEQLLDLTELAESVTGNGYFHSLQANSKGSSEAETVHRCKFLVMMRSFQSAYGDQLEPALVREFLPAQENCDLTVIVNAYFRHNQTMLYETDITDAPWKEVVSNAAVLDFLTHLVNYKGWDAPAHYWDFTTITLCSIMCSIELSKHSWDSVKVGVLARGVSRLYATVSRFISSVQEESMKRRPSQHVVQLPQEWHDIFAPDLHSNLFSLIMHVLKSDTSKINSNRAAVIEGLMRCTEQMDWGYLPKVLQTQTFVLSEVIGACTSCMHHSTHLAYNFLAHSTILMITDPLVLEDMDKLSRWSELEEEEKQVRPTLGIEFLDSAYRHLQTVALAALDAEQDDDVGVWEERRRWCAWMVLADALHTMLCRARGQAELQQQVVQLYRERGYAEPLLSAALRLLPQQLPQHALDNTTPPPTLYEACFLTTPTNSVYLYEGDTELVERLACRCVWWAVSGGGGGAVRAWSAAASPRTARLLTYLVRSYITPHLVREQLTHLQRYADQLEDAEVTIRWSSNEVSCEFPIEERRIELRVWFARDHPLGLPRAAGPCPGGPAVNTSWIVFYLAYQNGMLLNALKMWMEAVNSRVESAPQCYVCYCRMEPISGRLPSIRCHQCNNKFHGVCLRKWFTTSKKSNCPLCRSPF